MRGFPRYGWWLMLAWFLAGCPSPDSSPGGSGADGPGKEEVARWESLFSQSWARYVAAHPENLKALLDESPKRGAWVGYYNRDYKKAQEAFKGAQSEPSRIGLGRSHLADAEVYLAAYSLALEVERLYLELWEENAARVPKTGFFDYMAGLTALRTGDSAAAVASFEAFRVAESGPGHSMSAVADVWYAAALEAAGDKDRAARVLDKAKTAGSPAAAALLVGLDADTTAAEDERLAILERVREEAVSQFELRTLFWAQVQLGQIEQAEQTLARVRPRESDYQEVVTLREGSVNRHYFDPLVLQGLARLHARKALKALEGIELAARCRGRAEAILGREPSQVATSPRSVDAAVLPVFLFSSFPTPADMGAAGVAGESGGDKGEGVFGAFARNLGPVGESSLDGRDTRQAIELAQAFVDAGKRSIQGTSEEGANTVSGLKLIEADMFRALRARAKQYVAQRRFLDALYLLEHTVEKESDKFTYINDPLLFVDITRVYCAIGRYREAMNYLYRLVKERPELWLIQEKLGNLSVLGTVDHAGRAGQQD